MHLCYMGIMKRIIENQLYDKRAGGLHFVNENPEVTLVKNNSSKVKSGNDLMNKTVNLELFNNDIKGWGRKVAKLLRQETRTRFDKGKKAPRVYKSGIHRGKRENKLSKSIRVKFRKEPRGEQIDTIAFGLERHGVFAQKGVGSGYVANGGGVARIAKTYSGKYRFQQNWFNDTLDKNIDELSNIIVKHTGDAIVLNTKRMFIQ